MTDGNSVTLRSGPVGLDETSSLEVGVALPRTSRCRSSASSSLSSPSVSNASASVGSTLFSLDAIDDDLEWKDGGGELGIGCVVVRG